MSQNLTVKRAFSINQGPRGRKALHAGGRKSKQATGRVPRVSRLMALAIRFDGLIQDGVVADQAELARLGRVTRARLTQIMNLLSLAPDIQEEILHLPRLEQGRDPLSERELRPIVAEVDWGKQRQMWMRSHASFAPNLCRASTQMSRHIGIYHDHAPCCQLR